MNIFNENYLEPVSTVNEAEVRTESQRTVKEKLCLLKGNPS